MALKKILLVSSGSVTRGGREVFLYSWLEHAPKEEYEFTCYFPGTIEKQDFAKELEQLGSRLVCGDVPSDTGVAKKSEKMLRDLDRLLKKESFDIVHINAGSVSTNAVALWAAKKNHILVRIAHSHSSGASYRSAAEQAIIHVSRYVINRCVTRRATCSREAAKALFGQKYMDDAVLVPNCIDARRFAFSQAARDECRRKLGLRDCFVLGQVARLAPEKNQKFLIDVFGRVYQKDAAARLLLVGAGPLEEELKAYAADKGLGDVVVFAGATSRPENFYCAMDVFVLPSLFEGFPIGGVEAQANGLPCVFSDSITREADILPENNAFLSLNDPQERWAEKVLALRDSAGGTAARENAWADIVAAGYDISRIQEAMNALYCTTD